MTDFNKKLSALLNENTEHMVFMDDPIYADIDESSIVNEISAAGPLYGLKYLGYSEGVLSFSTYQKSAIEKFALFLDDNEYTESYAISVIESNPMTKVANVVDEIDFEATRESEFVEFFIDVIINWNYVTYNDVYVDPTNPFATNPSTSFQIPMDASDPYTIPGSDNNNAEFYDDEDEDDDEYEYTDEDDDEYEDQSELPINTTPGFDALQADETPLLVKLSAIKSNSLVGSVLVTVHPKNEDEILVQAVYKEIPDVDSVLRDLSVINTLDQIYPTKIELITEAQYQLEDLTTTAAVYRSINSTNVLNIIEVFANDADEVQCDINLLSEVRRVIKVNFRGKKRIKMKCQPGFKYDPSRMACVKISGSELSISRISHRQMARTKKALGASYRTRILRKVRRAKRFRKMMGL